MKQKKLNIFPRYGGKAEKAPKIVQKIKEMGFKQDTHFYIEPFCGALSVGLNLNPRWGGFIDNDRYLMRLLNTLQKDYIAFKIGIESHISKVNKLCAGTLTREYFFRLINIFNDDNYSWDYCTKKHNSLCYCYLKEVILFIIIKTSYSSIYEYKKKDNKIYASYSSLKSASKKGNFEKIMRKCLKNIEYIKENTHFNKWDFLWHDSLKLKLSVKKAGLLPVGVNKEFFYIDPPYANSKNKANINGFSQTKLYNWTNKLNKKTSSWIMSNKYTEKIAVLYKDYEKEIYKKSNHVNKTNTYYDECLIWYSIIK